MCQLRATDAAGVAAGGYGIRIDIPFEEQYRAGWHQDYPAQLRSPDGLVFWSSLVPVTEEMGPVVFCRGSHREGTIPVHTHDPRSATKRGAYALVFENEEQVVGRFAHVAPLTQLGDLILVDFQTIHRSGCNRSNRSRWSMQMRYFNYRHPLGVQIGWKGSFAAGVNLADVHPDLVIE